MYKSWRSAWCKKAELSDPADSDTPRRLPHGKYVLHPLGCSQEDDQLLREGRQRPHPRRRHDSRHTIGSGHVDEDAAAAVDSGDGSDHFYELDLRSRVIGQVVSVFAPKENLV